MGDTAVRRRHAPRPAREPLMDFKSAHALGERLVLGLEAVIRGKSTVLGYLVAGLLAGGHVLIEDVPGLGKTTLAKTVARLISRTRKGDAVVFRRIQFTPDLLPYDITGVDVFDPGTRKFVFTPVSGVALQNPRARPPAAARRVRGPWRRRGPRAPPG